ncbi:MAG TPA: hypothetical protein VKI65_06085, partial [Gemmataceae bacterium]|nr:hypothetical protein [Gemmataceae bacterium]
LTRVYAWCTKATKNQELAEKYAARAVEFFRLAIAEGFRDLPRLQKNLELDVLGKREDFQKLVAELETKIKEGK